MTRRALVLGGGGVTGVAWELGVLAGLAEGGVDLAEADLLVGTSAGSVVATLIATGVEIEKAYASQLTGPGSEIAAGLAPRTLAAYLWSAIRSRDARQFGTRVGALAIAATTPPAEERRAVIASRLPIHEWPDRDLKITAVDADSGEFVVFDRHSGVDLVDAVGASCAVPGVWPVVPIGDRRFIDGGMRSPVNADLADGCDRIVVVAPITSGAARGSGTARQVATLRGAGAEVAVVSPDRAARRAIGRNVLDPARRAASARAGRAQAAIVAPTVSRVWGG